MNKIEKKQAELQNEHSIKITQTELLEKIVDNAMEDSQIVENILEQTVDIEVVSTKK
jgi:hypothetical protein